ncbi:MAG TPA: efflux transporter outer membrane subunit [Steroidobacteraceae bacterium]|nr:efflux transporter outer membrane subunit [Steroidobacteraceae bacterium]
MCGLALLLGSCAVGPTYRRPPPPPVDHYVRGADPVDTPQAQGVAQSFVPGAALTGDWWHPFHSPAIDEVVTQALRNNPGLDAARASLRQSEDTLRSGYGIFFPQAELDASGIRQRFTTARFGEAQPSSIFNLFTLSASVSYVLDVFGGERRMVEGLKTQVDLARANEAGVYIALIANIVNTVVARAAYQAEIDATQRLIDLQSEQVKIARIQAQAGTVPYSSVLSLQSQLASYQAGIPQLQQKLSQSEDLLATLAGYAPAQWDAPKVTLAELSLPRELPVEVPSELVSRRPDILMAEANAHAASANLGVATANMLPSITLTGDYSANALRTQNLLSSKGRAWSAAADLTAPIFEGGTLWYRRKAAVDAYRQTSALYRQTVLGAFAQVADTLRALEHDAAALAAEDLALDSAREALKLVNYNYSAGLATYLDVLNADAQYHQAKINDLAGTAVRYQDTVALYMALGGGWWNASPAVTTDERVSSRR